MGVVITRDDIIAYAEVDYIIKHMDEKYMQKVPEKLLLFFETIKDPELEINIDPYKPLQLQGLKRYTLEIIALLHLKYWCENEERKKELYDLMLRNQEKLEEQMREKFSIDNLFDNNSVTKVTEEADLEKPDFSRPKVVQYYDQYTEKNSDIQDYTDLREVEQIDANSEKSLPHKIEDKESKNIISKLFQKILGLFSKKEQIKK